MTKQKEKAAKYQFNKSLSRESFKRGKDVLNDDLQEMEICVHEIKQARRKHNIKNDMTKMNEPEYDSDLSDYDQQFFSSSGRININQVKSSLQQYHSTKPMKESSIIQPTYSQYTSLQVAQNESAEGIKKEGNAFKKLANKT